jgi:charged multivesicular body protein 7
MLRYGRLASEPLCGSANGAQAAAKAVLDHASSIATSNTSRVISRELFISTFADTIGVSTLSPNDTSILLRHLARDRSAIAVSSNGNTIKFKSSLENEPPEITSEDVNIASMRTLMASIEPQIDELTWKVSDLDRAAKEAVANKQMLAAKSALRTKKLTQTKLEQRTATLSQLEDVYAKIEQAADQVEMVRVMEAAGQTLKSLNKQTGGVEKVQDVMEGLQAEMANADEIGQALNESSASQVDEGEVDEEFEELEKVERERQEGIEKRDREAREAAEAKETETREEAEAEQTRSKLAELDTPVPSREDAEEDPEAGVLPA